MTIYRSRTSGGGYPAAQQHAAGSRRAFTLLELLVVLGIISILLGLLLPAIRAVQNHARKSIAQGEVKTIESAWKLYYAHYHRWPTNEVVSGSNPWSSNGWKATTYIIDAAVADALQGVTNDPSLTSGEASAAGLINPDGLQLMEFTRFDTDGAPVSPWYRTGQPSEGLIYQVTFDSNGNNQVPHPMSPSDNSRPINRRVIVWTRDPTKNPASDESYIGSWKR